MPHLFIIGVMRSGTTFLAKVLDEHPKICFSKPIVPEAKFFLYPENREKGADYYRRSLFPFRGEGKKEGALPPAAKVLGEKTVHYFERTDALEAIARIFPDALIIIVFREPVERAFSNYRFSIANGLETRSIEEVFLKNTPPPKRPKDMHISPFAYVERGEYAEALRRVFSLFPRRHVLPLISERLWGRRDELQKVFRFLDVDERFTPKGLQERVFSTNSQTGPSDDRVRQECIDSLAAHYRPCNRELEQLLGFEIPEWKR